MDTLCTTPNCCRCDQTKGSHQVSVNGYRHRVCSDCIDMIHDSTNYPLAWTCPKAQVPPPNKQVPIVASKIKLAIAIKIEAGDKSFETKSTSDDVVKGLEELQETVKFLLRRFR